MRFKSDKCFFIVPNSGRSRAWPSESPKPKCSLPPTACWRAALRYFLVASVSFAANELLYALALRWLPWHYLASLLAVLLLVAVGTFISAKFWAFRAAGAA